MQILTAAEMQQTDARSGVPFAALMERAGEAVAAFCLRQYPLAARVMVVCGKGNNGGDGFVAARLLAAEGVGVRVLLAGSQWDVKGAAAEALNQLREATSDDVVAELPGTVTVDELQELLAEADLIVDAVLGTGFKPPLRGVAALLREALEEIEVPVLAVDLPSGWDADSLDERSPQAFRADAVITFTAPKLAHVFGAMTTGIFEPVVVAEIGTPAAAIQSEQRLTWTGASKPLTELKRPINSNKGKFGHVLVVGGSFGIAGAPSMSSLAALRAGAGLVTAAVPRAIWELVAAAAPELMIRPLWQPPAPTRSEAHGTVGMANLEPERLAELLKGIKVIALGPGLSTKGASSEFARDFVAQAKDHEGKWIPIVIDADALNAFAGHPELLDGTGRTMVLTPHPGEMARLLGCTVKEVEADRIDIARAFAMKHQVTLVLKGWRTLVAHPDGRIAVNTTGNPALAKGGSGDILTGIVAAMLAQYPDDVAGAVEAAVYLHGLAADFAVQDVDEKCVLATDVLAHLTNAFRYRTRDEDDFEWVAGLRLKAPAVVLD